MLKKINISTKNDIFEITSDVKKIVEESGVKREPVWCTHLILQQRLYTTPV